MIRSNKQRRYCSSSSSTTYLPATRILVPSLLHKIGLSALVILFILSTCAAMDHFDYSGQLAEALQAHPRQTKQLTYGTAGFRDKASLPLHSVFVKMGMLAAARSRSVNSKCVGVMITASHNPECDNGVKLVDNDGGMISQRWEPFAEALVNAETVEDAIAELEKIYKSENISKERSTKSVVVIGRDTRPHSKELADCVTLGATAAGATVYDLGEVTTPQLHFVVQATNSIDIEDIDVDPECAIANYHRTLSGGYIALRETAGGVDESCSAKGLNSIVIDGSNGIGAAAMADMAAVINTFAPGALNVDLRNIVGSGPVNEGCGAELVQKNQVQPKGVSADSDRGKIMCSFDGDADRIVFHSFLADENKWVLLDGDKIAALISLMLSQELRAAGLDSEFRMGVVQTAYANGASTIFLKKHGIPIAVAKTGVKYLHHKAMEYDMGVYFEANGHGTVLMSRRLLQRIYSWSESEEEADGVGAGAGAAAAAAESSNSNSNSSGDSERRKLAMKRLQACTEVINQAVGDAISDMLLILATLQVLGMDLPAWNAIYTDLPSRQLKVPVPVANKSLISCSEDETRALTPPGLQEALDAAMAATPLGRCFVRPSGTEDVVRIYAEAETQELADELANAAISAIDKFVNINN